MIHVPGQRLVSLLIVSILVTISPLAYWETPDPVWLPGYFDEGHHDDAIASLELRHLSAAVVLAVYISAAPVASVPLPAPLSEQVPPEQALPATPTRAPPSPSDALQS